MLNHAYSLSVFPQIFGLQFSSEGSHITRITSTCFFQVMGLAWTNMGGATLYIEARGGLENDPVSIKRYGNICARV